MAIPISHLFTAEGSERNLEMLRRECYDLEGRYREALIQCEISADGNRVISPECKTLQKAFFQTKKLLDAIENNLLSSARKGEKFKSGRNDGAIGDVQKHINKLVAANPEMEPNELL